MVIIHNEILSFDISKTLKFKNNLNFMEKAFTTTYLTNKWDVFPSEAVQWMIGVVKVAEPLVGLVRIKHLLWFL